MPFTKSEGKERLLAVYNHSESGKFLSLESGILGFGIPNLATKKSGILLSLTKKMLLKKKKTNPDFGYIKELRLAQDSLQMIWRCLGFWGTLNKMWKNSAERSYSCGILGQLRFNTENAKWCVFLKRQTPSSQAKEPELILLLEITHCTRNLQIS